MNEENPHCLDKGTVYSIVSAIKHFRKALNPVLKIFPILNKIPH